MKYFMIIMLVSYCLLMSCTTPEQKAKKIIKESLMRTMNDPKSYVPISFSGLDSVYLSYDSIFLHMQGNPTSIPVYDKVYNSILDSLNVLHYNDSIYWHDIVNTMPTHSEMMRFTDSTMKIAEYLYDQRDKREKFLKDSITTAKVFIGLKMLHSFRGKNAYGALIIQNENYIFDTALTTIIRQVRL